VIGARCGSEAPVSDVMDVCAVFHLHRFGGIGTSFGGLLVVGLAGIGPNNMGPELGGSGARSVRNFIDDTPNTPAVDVENVGYARAFDVFVAAL
jgi:hypothetical protein